MKFLFLLAILLVAINAASSTNQLPSHIHVPAGVVINQTKPVQLVNSVQVNHAVNMNHTTEAKKTIGKVPEKPMEKVPKKSMKKVPEKSEEKERDQPDAVSKLGACYHDFHCEHVLRHNVFTILRCASLGGKAWKIKHHPKAHCHQIMKK